MEKNLSYNKAYTELEKLVGQIESEEIQLDTLADKVKEANDLIRFCQTKLRTIEADIKAVTTPDVPDKKRKKKI